jgi:phosphatidylglycerophosphatase A
MSITGAAPVPRSSFLSSCATLIATGLGSGYAPWAPGTAGSAVGLVLFWPVAGLAPLGQLTAIAVVSLIGIAAATNVARRLGRHDPGIVVVDEIAGMWVTLALLPLTPLTALAGFLAFRVMDIVKPFPARDLERLPDGWGIVADDLAAGVYANLLVRVLLIVLGRG